MKKANKLIISLGTAFAALSPVVLSVGCGGGGSSNLDSINGESTPSNENSAYANDKKGYNIKANDKVQIATTFSKGRAQYEALNDIIKNYNRLMKDQPGFKEVEQVSLGSGYDGQADVVRKKITAKEAQMPNLLLNYSSLASSLAESGVLLNFTTKENGGKESISNSDFAESFSRANRTTSKINNGGSWLIPIAKSSINLGANGPVLSYVIESMLAKGAKIDPSWKDKWDKIKKSGLKDRAAVIENWGAVKSDVSALKLNELTIKESTFSNIYSLLEFCDKAQKMFEKSSAVTTLEGPHALGIDDITGFIQTLGYASVGADPESWITTVVEEDGERKISYKSFVEATSQANSKFKELYDMFVPKLKSQSVVFQQSGAYTSSEQIRHNFMFDIGSTAGYTHNFAKKSETSIEIKNSEGKFSSGWNENNNKFAQIVKHDDGTYRIGGHLNKIKKDTEKLENYEWKAKTADIYNKLAGYSQIPTGTKKISSPSGTNVYAFMIETKNKDDIKTLDAALADGKLVKVGEFVNNQNKEAILYLAFGKGAGISGLKIVEKGLDSLLEKDEFFKFATPSKTKDTDAKNVYYAQGPSLFGIRSSDNAMNQATRMFVKWFVTSGATELEYKDQETGNVIKKVIKPSLMFSEQASYIFAVKDFEKTPMTTTNPYLRECFEMFKKTIEDPEHNAIYEEYGDPNGDAFRGALGTAWRNVYGNKSPGQYKDQIIDAVVASNNKLFN
ncbi:Uncharacterized lipoprotein MPN_097 precursor (plasmid) [Mesomycoplasma conjunctivae]|nr:P80 family lipoprotein [Mycoplasmopsis fermentans]VEU60357.1 Uncharacterized lipoprotein MPN_097 precursor [Mycoplasmopsis fermentans]VEU67499.1 Uncharacterized lipoprotein MPN_097 precursor [Mesomycoplasma conjunctivae]